MGYTTLIVQMVVDDDDVEAMKDSIVAMLEFDDCPDTLFITDERPSTKVEADQYIDLHGTLLF